MTELRYFRVGVWWAGWQTGRRTEAGPVSGSLGQIQEPPTLLRCGLAILLVWIQVALLLQGRGHKSPCSELCSIYPLTCAGYSSRA